MWWYHCNVCVIYCYYFAVNGLLLVSAQVAGRRIARDHLRSLQYDAMHSRPSCSRLCCSFILINYIDEFHMDAMNFISSLFHNLLLFLRVADAFVSPFPMTRSVTHSYHIVNSRCHCRSFLCWCAIAQRIEHVERVCAFLFHPDSCSLVLVALRQYI